MFYLTVSRKRPWNLETHSSSPPREAFGFSSRRLLRLYVTYKYTPVNAIRATSHLVPSVTLSVDWLTADRTIRDETRFRSRQKSAISARPRRSRFLPRTIPFLLGAIRSHDQSSEHEQYCELSSIKQTGADLGFVYSFTLPVFRFFTRDISFAFKPWPFFARQLSIIDLIVPTREYVTHERFIIEKES